MLLDAGMCSVIGANPSTSSPVGVVRLTASAVDASGDGVRDVSFTLNPGQITTPAGESGSTQSVMARAVMTVLSRRARVTDATRIDYRAGCRATGC